MKKDNIIGVSNPIERKRRIYVMTPDPLNIRFPHGSIGWKTIDDKKPVLGAYLEFTLEEMAEIKKYL